MSKLPLNRYKELSHFLRSRRERLTPKEVGLPQTGYRRTPGLRRGEVATLAGISLEWYTFLEQGRSINVSIELLENLSQALRLNPAEHRHLFLLAHCQPPPVKPTQSSEVNGAIKQFIKSLGYSPACLLDERMNMIVSNDAFKAVFGKLEQLPKEEQNYIWVTFMSADFRAMKGDQWEPHAKRVVAQFRAKCAQYLDDPWWNEQTENLIAASPEFKAYWELHEVEEDTTEHKIIHHPTAGKLAFDYLSFRPQETVADILIAIHVPKEDGITEGKIRELLAE
ncbi:helix-turn-helix transcriptional regulator [Alkalicoccobacillus porphyridii]|uniref:helix-turn-helix transcriptional regulator n=1 Tax=Alkalicoccobacillus porphyridii TaxID=2597270 RepID=UPI00163DCC92|nr:helix-turn-helix transcriptional regulator [Alkalicoccobacillus porphyridii]